MATTPATTAAHQVNLLLLLLQEKGDNDLASTGAEEPYSARDPLRSLAH